MRKWVGQTEKRTTMMMTPLQFATLKMGLR